MTSDLSKFLRHSVAIAAACTAAAAFAAPAAGTSADAQAAYQKERAACMSGTSGQDRETCLREAGAARDEARRGNLNDGKGELGRNAKDRCNSLAGEQRSDCLARLNGEGSVSGSVNGGGVLREKVTIVPGSAGGSTDRAGAGGSNAAGTATSSGTK
jgi:hypothetical protein